ncbi:hypothetical protein TNCV_4744731 [Trichonephila clavipes]|nr:hypothetical protein TNCV_4744731 [Trichonephila clavipes]
MRIFPRKAQTASKSFSRSRDLKYEKYRGRDRESVLLHLFYFEGYDALKSHDEMLDIYENDSSSASTAESERKV